MKILITGIAGFVGSKIAQYFKEHGNIEIIGIDNLSRRGSESNLPLLQELGCTFVHGDIRSKEDIEELPKVDWMIDCAAIPTVTAGLSGGTAQLINHNLTGTLHLLEKCRKDNSGFIMLSTSRVYSVNELNNIPLTETESRFIPDYSQAMPPGFTTRGVSESFSTASPISIYGATKLASEILALEYHYAFNIPVWINRCGVIAGAGQFGKIDQGIFSFWIYQWILDKPLSYIGFGGIGKQVRDFISPTDIFRLIQKQIANPNHNAPRVINFGGGLDSAMSLFELNQYCESVFKKKKVIQSDPQTRPYDIPYYVTDNKEVEKWWGINTSVNATELLQQIIDNKINAC